MRYRIIKFLMLNKDTTMRRGFTLIEMIIVIIIIGIIATLGLTQYAEVVERARAAEAMMILGGIRTLQEAYKLEHGTYASDIGDLPVTVPIECAKTHYFSYSVAETSKEGYILQATRCISDGKPPQGPIYTVTLDQDGSWGGIPAY